MPTNQLQTKYTTELTASTINEEKLLLISDVYISCYDSCTESIPKRDSEKKFSSTYNMFIIIIVKKKKTTTTTPPHCFKYSDDSVSLNTT